MPAVLTQEAETGSGVQGQPELYKLFHTHTHTQSKLNECQLF